MYLCGTELFEIQLLIGIKMDLVLSNPQWWYAIKPNQTISFELYAGQSLGMRILPLSRDTVGVLYNPSQLGFRIKDTVNQLLNRAVINIVRIRMNMNRKAINIYSS